MAQWYMSLTSVTGIQYSCNMQLSDYNFIASEKIASSLILLNTVGFFQVFLFPPEVTLER